MVTVSAAGRPQTSQTKMVCSPMMFLLPPGNRSTGRIFDRPAFSPFAVSAAVRDGGKALEFLEFVMRFDVPDGPGARSHHHGERGGAVEVVVHAPEQRPVRDPRRREEHVLARPEVLER